ncbi:PREDICTED: uncharacterized protein LOC107336737 [Paramuricea clavata]|uniref:PREDICTED: uncharacterized protein LOC107336737 n=1 Tax=Paramuricea clavata TaxID=317549 RepID=A0A7D9I561_PARCT|nr:PREDICTED: uncharacterized protein LOC107336737 [Paramuricea clavata]
MATMPIVNPMPPFDPDSDIGANIGPKWKIWMEDFEMYITTNGITNKAKKQALLLYQAGAQVRVIFRQIPDNGDDKDYKAVEKLNKYFEPQKHRLYKVYKFREARQDVSETLDQCYTRLRSLSTRCEFADPDFEIMVQIVVCGRSSLLRKQALRDPKLTLKDLLVLGRQCERSRQQAAEIEEGTRNNQTGMNDDAVVDAVRNTPCWKDIAKRAKGKECRKCSKLNHFARVCQSAPAKARGQRQDRGRWQGRHENKPIRPLNVSDNESSDSDNYCYSVNDTKTQNPYTKLKINNRNVKFTVDTGSSINIIDQQTFEQTKTNIKAYAFNSNVPVKMNGKFTTIVESRRKITVTTIYVTKANGGCLLSGSTAEELGLISWHLNAVQITTSSQTAPTFT